MKHHSDQLSSSPGATRCRCDECQGQVAGAIQNAGAIMDADPTCCPADPVHYPTDPALRLCFLCDREGLPAFWDPTDANADLVGAPRNEDGVPGRLHLFLCFACVTRPGAYQQVRDRLLEMRQ